MAKKITGFVKLQIPAGKATPAPPVGPALGQHGIVREDRELEHHLVDLAVAVAADAEELVRERIEHRDDLLRRVIARQVVARAMVENVPEEEERIGLFLRPALHQQFAVIRRPVQVGRDHPFHGIFPLLSCF